MMEHGIVIPYDVSMQYVDERMRRMYHDFFDWGNELVMIFDGQADYYYNETCFPVRKGDVFVLRGDYYKEVKNARRLRMCSVFYREDTLQRLAGTFRRLEGYQTLFVLNPLIGAYRKKDRLQADESLLLDLDKLVDRMVYEQKLKEPGYEQILNSTFFVLITLIARGFAAGESVGQSSTVGFTRTVVYMEENYWDNIRICDLARLAGVSERHFNRRFRELYSIAPSQYLMNLRLKRACALLEEGDLSISDIAMDCGFSDINYFSKVFRAAIHMAPSEYRREKQKGKGQMSEKER